MQGRWPCIIHFRRLCSELAFGRFFQFDSRIHGGWTAGGINRRGRRAGSSGARRDGLSRTGRRSRAARGAHRVVVTGPGPGACDGRSRQTPREREVFVQQASANCRESLRRITESIQAAGSFIGQTMSVTETKKRLRVLIAAPSLDILGGQSRQAVRDRKSTRLNSSHSSISYAVFCLKKK